MRKTHLLATTTLFFILGGVGANAANPNVPASSPYALMNVAPWSASSRDYRDDRASEAIADAEGRAAYVDRAPQFVPSSRHLVSRGADVIVHTRRSYLDPGTTAEIGTEDRYFSDTAHFDFRSEGPDFTRDTAGFELLR